MRSNEGVDLLRPRADGAMAALFPELARDGRIPAPTGSAAWAGARGTARLRARATAGGVPFVMLGQGLLRAPPPQWRFRRSAPPCLSALALEIAVEHGRKSLTNSLTGMLHASAQRSVGQVYWRTAG